jgi:hypothetical protein
MIERGDRQSGASQHPIGIEAQRSGGFGESVQQGAADKPRPPNGVFAVTFCKLHVSIGQSTRPSLRRTLREVWLTGAQLALTTSLLRTTFRGGRQPSHIGRNCALRVAKPRIRGERHVNYGQTRLTLPAGTWKLCRSGTLNISYLLNSYCFYQTLTGPVKHCGSMRHRPSQLPEIG